MRESKMKESKMLYFIPLEDKPIKLVFEDLPCPILEGMRCAYAKNTSHDMIFEISCTYKSESGKCIYF